MNLAKIISNQSRAVIVLVVLLCVAGIYAAFVLPSSIFPQTDFPRIVIIVDNGDVPAEQMLVSVTRPVEEAMNGIPGIANIRSTTARGSADINLFFDWNVDIVQSLQLVQARVSQLNLPPTAQIRRVDRLTFAVFPVSGYSLTSDKRDLTALRDIASFTIRRVWRVWLAWLMSRWRAAMCANITLRLTRKNFTRTMFRFNRLLTR